MDSNTNAQTFQTTEAQYTSGVYAKRNLTLVRGVQATLWDDTGRAFIDCVGGQGVSTLGHANPVVAQAIADQATRLGSCPEIFYNDQRAAFYSALKSVVPDGLNRFFLSNSGAESMEAAMKFARLSTKRANYVAAVRGFHGRSMGALSATYEPKYRQPFMPLIEKVTHVPYNTLDGLEQAIDQETAAVILEAVQGEGGVHPGQAEFLLHARKLCTERGSLLIIDEVQTGFCRTGRWFACQHSGIQPDMMTMGKAIAGGVPMGGVAIADSVQGLSPLMHGSTFGGNPLACAAGVASIQQMKALDIAQQAAEKGAYIMQHIQESNLPMVREVRGMGLLIGLELKTKVSPYLAALQNEGILALPAGLNVLRLLPPAVISYKEIDQVIAALRKVLAS